ncbi:hypothetical protein OK016_20220 [Vibrio chagasii]|nr:hypothetical protein [Vibrio chagasii]
MLKIKARNSSSKSVELRSKPLIDVKQQTGVEPEALFDRSLKVLLVEDNHTNAFSHRLFCKKYGMVVTWAKKMVWRP